MANLFVIGIGGTGSVVLKHSPICVPSVFDNTDGHLLALDTDKDNGNFRGLKNLNASYLTTKGVKKKLCLKRTFFSANLHYYQFNPDYSKLQHLTHCTIMATQNTVILK
jgi:hypothetical protein